MEETITTKEIKVEYPDQMLDHRPEEDSPESTRPVQRKKLY